MLYYVVGGEFTDTDFRTLIEGSEERHGPMPKDQATETWKGLSMRHIDNCMIRYVITPAD